MNETDGNVIDIFKGLALLGLTVLFSTNFWGANLFSFLGEEQLAMLRIISGFVGFASLFVYFLLKKKQEKKDSEKNDGDLE